MINTVVLANTSIMSHNYNYFFVVRTFRIYSLNNFQVCRTVVVTTTTILYIRSPELTHFLTGIFYFYLIKFI